MFVNFICVGVCACEVILYRHFLQGAAVCFRVCGYICVHILIILNPVISLTIALSQSLSLKPMTTQMSHCSTHKAAPTYTYIHMLCITGS